MWECAGVVGDSRTLKRFWLDLYAQRKPMSGSSTKEQYIKATLLVVDGGLYENEGGERTGIKGREEPPLCSWGDM